MDTRDSAAVSGALSTLILYESPSRLSHSKKGKPRKLTNKSILEFYENIREEADNAALWVRENSTTRAPILAKKDQVFFKIIFTRIDPVMAEFYILKLINGLNLGETEPVTHVRDVILQRKTKGIGLTRMGMLNTVIRGWNATRRGAQIKNKSSLVWRPDKHPAMPAK